MNKRLKDGAFLLFIAAALVFAASIPLAMALGKYQVCKEYFPEISRYACFFTNLPPYQGPKK